MSTNQELVDGPTLARVLTGAGVSVLVLNACRSAYTEPQPEPDTTAMSTTSSDSDPHTSTAASSTTTTGTSTTAGQYGNWCGERLEDPRPISPTSRGFGRRLPTRPHTSCRTRRRVGGA